jgi:shikimate kinase
MPLILITGTSASGKSTVAKELAKRDFEAYDTEHDGISAWYNKETGKRAAEFGEMPERTEEWLNQHEWLTSIDWVTEMSRKAVDKPIFLCGGSSNEAEVRAKCQKVIWLKTDEETIRKRVQNPRDHDYGTKPHELTAAIEGNKQKEAEYRELGAIMVDATKPIENVVTTILKKASPN